MLAAAVHVIVAILFFVLLLAGLIMVIIGLPGIWAMVLAAIVYTLIYNDIAWWVIGLFFGMSLLAEGAEFLLAGWGAKKYGSSSKGMIASIVGGIIGAILFTPIVPVLGSIFGAFAGSFAGAFLVEYLSGKKAGEAGRAGYGAFVGRAAGITVKAATAITIIAISMLGVIF